MLLQSGSKKLNHYTGGCDLLSGLEKSQSYKIF
ncbi:hypothetical protein PS712_05405 [Pseudomonas fluorescens]|uniref:Uncharacterized protein n=1 Tax=Pseudomonas fluorescens TaxID=294 RepID=A0A5E7FAC4_PSEFL|nr:hypothetical protein PS712_05405 [Pseudomonas fluorescens]